MNNNYLTTKVSPIHRNLHRASWLPSAVLRSHGWCPHKPFFIFFSQGMCPLEAVLINDSSIKLVPSFAIYYLKSMLQRELYFYTATIYKWKPLIKEFNLEPVITQSLSYLCQKECLRVYGFVIMPNHVHFIWELLQNNGKESPVSSFMKFTAHQFQSWLEQNAPRVLNEYRVDWHSRNYNFWQTKADWFLLTQASTIDQKLNYIHLNPMRGKWSLVSDPTEYYYSSCRFYEKGFNEFDLLKDYRDWTG